MKKIISIVLILSIAGGSIHLDELTKIPAMITHYSEHKKNHPSISFLAFLYEHYFLNQKPESEKDKEHNSQLPFKSLISFHSHIAPAICESSGATVYNNPITVSVFTFFKSRVFTRATDIWQPPKLS
jgi:hypothetical protein